MITCLGLWINQKSEFRSYKFQNSNSKPCLFIIKTKVWGAKLNKPLVFSQPPKTKNQGRHRRKGIHSIIAFILVNHLKNCTTYSNPPSPFPKNFPFVLQFRHIGITQSDPRDNTSANKIKILLKKSPLATILRIHKLI